MSELDPLTGKDPSSLTLATLTERLAMERALRESFERHIRELLDERRDSIEKALTLQATEYERRLDSLNGEAGRLAKVLDQSVPREVFDQYRETQGSAARLIADTLAEERGARASNQRLMAIGLAVVAVVGLVLRFLPLAGS